MIGLIESLLGFILNVIAGLSTPVVERRLSRWADRLVGDFPRIGGIWVLRYRSSQRSDGSDLQFIDVVLYQFGRRVRGVGHIEGEPADPFEYRGEIRRNTFSGSFRGGSASGSLLPPFPNSYSGKY